MASLDHLKTLVNTAQRPCPHLRGKKCPGASRDCAFWIAENVENGAQHAIVEGCMFMFQYMMSNAAVLESIRTQATLQQAGETVRKAFRVLPVPLSQRPLEIP